MLINSKSNIPELINPESFVMLYMRHATVDAMQKAKDIYDECIDQEGRWAAGDEYWDAMSILGAIYEAGRVQGKREERVKRYERSLSQI